MRNYYHSGIRRVIWPIAIPPDAVYARAHSGAITQVIHSSGSPVRPFHIAFAAGSAGFQPLAGARYNQIALYSQYTASRRSDAHWQHAFGFALTNLTHQSFQYQFFQFQFAIFAIPFICYRILILPVSPLALPGTADIQSHIQATNSTSIYRFARLPGQFPIRIFYSRPGPG